MKLSTQLLPGDPVLYYNKGTNQLVSGYYSSVFTSKFGPPVARDVQNPKYTKQVFFMGSDNFFVNAALKFSQAANFVKVDNARDIDLLQLTNEIIEGIEREVDSKEKITHLRNLILISLTSLKVD